MADPKLLTTLQNAAGPQLLWTHAILTGDGPHQILPAPPPGRHTRLYGAQVAGGSGVWEVRAGAPFVVHAGSPGGSVPSTVLLLPGHLLTRTPVVAVRVGGTARVPARCTIFHREFAD